MGAGVRPVAPRVPRHVFGQLRPQRLHRGARRRPAAAARAAARCSSSRRGRAACRRSAIAEETAALREAFRDLVKAGLAQVEAAAAGDARARCSAASPRAASTCSTSSATASTTRSEREGSLLLEDERGRPRLVAFEALRQILCRRGLRLVFLNACETGRGGRVEWNRGVAPGARRGGHPGRGREPVLGARQRGDRSSRASFYAPLARGRSIGDAAREARVAVGRETSDRRDSTGRCRWCSRASRARRCGDAVRAARGGAGRGARARPAARGRARDRPRGGGRRALPEGRPTTCSTSRGTRTRRSASTRTRRRGPRSRRRRAGRRGSGPCRSRSR